METCLLELIWLFITGNDTHIIAGDNLLRRTHRHGKCLASLNILGGLVTCLHADGQLRFLRYTAPGSVHYLDANGKVDVAKLRPITFDPVPIFIRVRISREYPTGPDCQP